MYFNFEKNTQRGLSLVELLVALGLFVTLVATLYGAILVSNKAILKASEKIQAAFLLEEGMEAIKRMRDDGWDSRIKSKSTTAGAYCLDFGENSFGVATSTANRVVLYHMEESSWSGASGEVKDDSGKDNNGQSINGASITSSGYLNSKGGNFDGTNDYISVPYTVTYFDMQDMTLEAWVNPSVTKDHAVIAKKTAGTSVWDLSIGSDGKIKFNITKSGGAATTLTSSNTVPLNTWTHVVATYDYDPTQTDASVRLYINGTQDVTMSDSAVGPTNYGVAVPITIGYRYESGTSAYFSGKIDEVSIYNRALTADEVYESYKAGIACKKIDNVYTRTVVFANSCRKTSDDDIDGNIADPCTGGSGVYKDEDTKKITISVGWGAFSDSVSLYLANVYKN